MLYWVGYQVFHSRLCFIYWVPKWAIPMYRQGSLTSIATIYINTFCNWTVSCTVIHIPEQYCTTKSHKRTYTLDHGLKWSMIGVNPVFYTSAAHIPNPHCVQCWHIQWNLWTLWMKYSAMRVLSALCVQWIPQSFCSGSSANPIWSLIQPLQWIRCTHCW